MTLIRSLALCLGALALSSAAHGETNLIDAFDPAAVAKAMQDAGYRAELDIPESGNPKITSATRGVTFWVYFGACEDDGSECELLNFQSGFDMDTPVDTNLIMTWNREHYGAAFVDDDGDPFVSLPVNMRYGVSSKNFADTLLWWDIIVGDFSDHVGFE